jgi:hypothetical protein
MRIWEIKFEKDDETQASWGRLELKPKKRHKSRFRHMNNCFPSTPIQG